MKTQKHLLIKFSILSVLVLGMFAISHTKADEPKPSAQDIQNLQDIKANQEVLEETREAHERFMQAKAWNENENAELAKNGWCVKWDDLTLVQCSFLHGEQ